MVALTVKRYVGVWMSALPMMGWLRFMRDERVTGHLNLFQGQMVGQQCWEM